MTPDIDERGRAAAQAVHDAVADTPLPHLDLSAAPARRWRRPALLAAAACLALAVGVAALVLGTGDGESGGDVATEGDALPRLLLDPVPGDLEVTGVVELPLPDYEGIDGEMWLYGDPDAADPLVAAHVGVTVARGVYGDDPLGDTHQVEYEHEPPRRVETAGGVAGVLWQFDDGPNLMLDVGGGSMVSLRGSATGDELLAVADALAVVASDASPPSSLPGGYELLATQPWPSGVAGMLGSPILAGDGVGYGIGYQGSNHTTFVLNAIEAGNDDELMSRWLLGAADPIEVRGTTGWLASPYPDAHWVLWRETPTTLVGVLSTLGEAETLAAIESLRPATPAEWAALPRSRATDGSPLTSDDAISGGLAGEDVWWSVALESPDELCVEVSDRSGSRSTCVAGHDDPLVAGIEPVGDDTQLLYGVAWFAADDVRITTEGAATDLEVRPTASIGLLFAGTVGAGDDVPTAVVVDDVATGEELARVTVGSASDSTGSATTIVSGSGDGG